MPVAATIKKNVGESGYADVRIGKNIVRIMFKSGVGYELEPDQWEKGRPAGEYNITMTLKGDKIMGVRPTAGTYIMEFKSFGNLVNEIPEPKVQLGGPRQSSDGKKKWYQPDSLAAVTLLEVQSEGRFQGLVVYNNIPYIFSPVQGTNSTKLEARSQKELERVESFLRVSGFDLATEDIPFSVNVLPWLQRRLNEVKRPFLGTIGETGFITSVAELPKELAPKKAKKK